MIIKTQHYSQEMIDDIKRMKPFDPEIEIVELKKLILREDRKKKIRKIFR